MKTLKANITLSISSDLLRHLRLEAKLENVSLNQKVNDVLIRWLYLYRAIGVSGAIVISRNTWENVIDKMDEGPLSELLDYEGKIAASILAQNDIPATLENLIEHIFSRTGLFSGAFTHFHHTIDHSGNTVLIFDHVFGLKWSRVLGGSFCRFISNECKFRTELTTTNRIIKILVDSSHIP